MKKIFVYVQHLLGVGHLHRTALITAALANQGFDVTVVSGGPPDLTINFGNVNSFQLPEIHTDSNFSDLFDSQGKSIDKEFKNSRCKMLLEIFDNVAPNLLIVESYPFARRQMRFELLPLLKKAKSSLNSKVTIACSIRDIIQPKKKRYRTNETIEIIDTYFDYIFVHGDKNFIGLEKSFPNTTLFKEKLIYTGYITKPSSSQKKSPRRQNHVLVSAGGGAAGLNLYKAAIEASSLRTGQQYTWHIMIGNNLEKSEFNLLKSKNSDNVTIERNRTDFTQLLSQTAVSVSQAGYNTMMDLMVTNTPGVVVPFEGQSEEEQLLRANAFVDTLPITLLRENELSGTNLLEKISQCLNMDNNLNYGLKIAGAERMADTLTHLV